MKWQDKLTKAEMRHVRKDAGCRTLAQFKNTVEWQREQDAKDRKAPFACMECHFIAKKLDI